MFLCFLRLTSTAQPEWELPKHGKRKGIQGAELCRDAANKHWSHDQNIGGTATVSKYVTIYVTLMHMGYKQTWARAKRAWSWKQYVCNVVPLAVTLSILWFGFRSRHWGAHWGGRRSSQHLQAREEGLISIQSQSQVHPGSTAELHQPLTEIYEHKHLIQRTVYLNHYPPAPNWNKTASPCCIFT